VVDKQEDILLTPFPLSDFDFSFGKFQIWSTPDFKILKGKGEIWSTQHYLVHTTGIDNYSAK